MQAVQFLVERRRTRENRDGCGIDADLRFGLGRRDRDARRQPVPIVNGGVGRGLRAFPIGNERLEAGDDGRAFAAQGATNHQFAQFVGLGRKPVFQNERIGIAGVLADHDDIFEQTPFVADFAVAHGGHARGLRRVDADGKRDHRKRQRRRRRKHAQQGFARVLARL